MKVVFGMGGTKSRIYTYIHTTRALFPKVSRGVSDILPIRPRFTKMLSYENNADLTGGRPIAV
jgi:hypothetical protein